MKWWYVTCPECGHHNERQAAGVIGTAIVCDCCGTVIVAESQNTTGIDRRLPAEVVRQ